MSQRKILLVEDEVIIALMEIQQLKKEGYEVAHVTSGEECIEYLDDPNEKVDLVLMDIDLGVGIDGTVTAKKILEKKDIPVLFLSSRIEKEMVQKTEKITSYGYVVKNSGITVLDASIKMAFKLHEANKTIKQLNESLQKHLTEKTKKLEAEVIAHAKTEQSYIESEDRFRIAQDISLEAFTIMRAIRDENNNIIDFTWTYANQIAGKILKIEPEKLIGKKLLEELPGNLENQNLFKRYVRIVETGIGDDVELKYTSEGIDGWFRNMAVKLGDGIAISFSDITERKQAELILLEHRGNLEEQYKIQNTNLQLINEKLEEEIKVREKYESAFKEEMLYSETLISSLPGVFYRVNAEGQLLSWNKNLENLIGKEGIELAKSNVLNIIHPEDREIIQSAIQLVFLENHAETSGRILSSSGEHRDFFFVGKLWNQIFLLGSGIDVTEYKKAELKVQNLLQEKETILKEVYHRVKNNMNTIYGLLTMQANNLDENQEKSILLDAANRVQSMMLLYNTLYHSEKAGKVSLKEYLPSLINEVIHLYPQSKSINVETEIENIFLNAKIVSPLGILINELITNAMKYAFENRQSGQISVKVYREDEFVVLVFLDDGVGIPESISFEKSTGFGIQLIQLLTKQIGGNIQLSRENGTRYELRFKG